MKDGFVGVCAITPNVKVADTEYNGEQIRMYMSECVGKGARIVVFPELCITGYTCGDLFLQTKLLKCAKDELWKIIKHSKRLEGIFFVGLPYELNGKLYNMAAALSGGKLLGLVPKSYIPNYNEFYEARYFASGEGVETSIDVLSETGTEKIPVGTDILFECETVPGLNVGVELCEDLWTPIPPSSRHACAGATIIVNLSASNEITGKGEYRKELVKNQSARLLCGYVYASAGNGESTQDVVYSGHNIVAENGCVLSESEKYENGITYSEIDVERLLSDRRRMSSFCISDGNDGYARVPFSLKMCDTVLNREIDAHPFVPGDEKTRAQRCMDILKIQAMGLKKRLEHTGCNTAVVGISGGLDSTLALLVTAKAFDLCNKERAEIIAVTMPGFGTTDRTYENAVKLIERIGATFREVNIKDAVNQHFHDIGQDAECLDVTYENSQARERTQILMDIANKTGGMVIGTGDLSELALGWATYNGDHMSMYGVNSSVPKTLVRHLVKYYADTCGDDALMNVLLNVLDTPVSPELLPPKDGKISQRTENLVGPYELHDFFLLNMLRYGFSPAKIYRLAKLAFDGVYEADEILKWLKVFYKRFFAQQFKRSCLPDGPKVGSVAVSPRGDLRMPSDACANIWLKELDTM